MNIHYFILTYQGLSIFEKNYKKNLNNEINLNIIDNGNQTSKKFENFIIHKTKKNIGCAGGWNLICLIAFNFLKLEKIIIGQDDTNVNIELLKQCYDEADEKNICGVFKPFFEFSTFCIHKKVFEKIGFFDENCIDVYCEDADYKQRCILNNIKIKNLGHDNNKNLGLSRLVNSNIKETILLNRQYILSKWGNSVNPSKFARDDYQPPYEFKNPYNDINMKVNSMKITKRFYQKHHFKNTFPSILEFQSFKDRKHLSK